MSSGDPVVVLRAFMAALDAALRDEGITAHTRKRITNRIMYGHPGGADTVRRMVVEESERAEQLKPPPTDLDWLGLPPASGSKGDVAGI